MRGPTTCKRLKKNKGEGGGEETSIEFDEYQRPFGQFRKNFKSYIGILVQVQVNINISD